MATTRTFGPSNPEDQDLLDVLDHYISWNEDADTRRGRKNGWDEVTDAYYGKLPDDWPYLSKVTDPVLSTTIIEKNSRLMNAKLRGRLVPREGGDVLGARINNALLDFQWENANFGGTMLEKWSISDQDTRLYASKFGKVTWRHEVDAEGNVIFDGNEFQPCDIRDCGMDSSADHLRNAKWFQHREWAKLEDLGQVSEVSGNFKFPGINKLKAKMAEHNSDRRDNAYVNRILNLKGLPDRVGEDAAFPVVELVTEYRKDMWITFSPRYKVILRKIKNPYKHGKIPFIQLRYFAIQGDPYGESEVERVLPLWRAIQATLCGYLDNMNMHMRPPLKILEGQARIESIVFGPEAQWIVNRPDAVTEHETRGEAMQYFQTTYAALKSAFATAMGDLSQGVSNIDPMSQDKTATEVRQSAKQQNSRDQKNQTSLAEAIQDMMSMWIANNKQFLFADPAKKEYILRIIGSDLFNYFQRAGLDEMEVAPEAMTMIGELVAQQGGNMSDEDIQALLDSGKTPKFPVFDNPNEKDPEKLVARPKLRMNDMGDGAELSLVPDDLNGNYDYIADVRSMATGADMELQQARLQALNTLTSNPTVLQLLTSEGVSPNIKELLISVFEGTGLTDAERFFNTNQAQPGLAPGGGPGVPGQVGGIPPELATTITGGNAAPPAQPGGLPGQGQIPAGVPGQAGNGASVPPAPPAF